MSRWIRSVQVKYLLYCIESKEKRDGSRYTSELTDENVPQLQAHVNQNKTIYEWNMKMKISGCVNADDMELMESSSSKSVVVLFYI